jgi:hypothetical protein
MFKDRRAKIPYEWNTSIEQMFSGGDRLDTEQRRRGERNDEVGKAVVPYQLFRALGSSLLAADNLFSWTYMLIQWNTCCRSDSVRTICFQHLKVAGDALTISFPQTKCDQEGTYSLILGPRHVYANTLNPEINVNLALALYFMCHPEIIRPRDDSHIPSVVESESQAIDTVPIEVSNDEQESLDSESNHGPDTHSRLLARFPRTRQHQTIPFEPEAHNCIFPGGDQDNRYYTTLKKHMTDLQNSFALGYECYNPSELGTHSLRKGAGSLLGECGSGSGYIAICLRYTE